MSDLPTSTEGGFAGLPYKDQPTVPLSRTRGILELLDRIEAYVHRHQQLPAALYLELRQAIERESA